MTRGRFLAQQMFGQSIEDVEQFVDTSSVSGWDIVSALIVLAASWPVSALAGRVTRWFVRRIPGVPEAAIGLVGRGARVFVVVIALAISMSLIGVNVGWFTALIVLVLLIVVLTIRPLIQNLAAGLLIEARPSFGVGDEIVTNGHSGEVIGINARSTVIRTRDGKRVHVPNTEVLSDAIVVLTAFDRRRSSIDLGIQYEADMAEVSLLLAAAASAVEGVHADPPPSVRARGFGDATYILSLRWWHDPSLLSESQTLDGVVREIKRVLDGAGIELPSPEIIVRRASDERSG